MRIDPAAALADAQDYDRRRRELAGTRPPDVPLALAPDGPGSRDALVAYVRTVLRDNTTVDATTADRLARNMITSVLHRLGAGFSIAVGAAIVALVPADDPPAPGPQPVTPDLVATGDRLAFAGREPWQAGTPLLSAVHVPHGQDPPTPPSEVRSLSAAVAAASMRTAYGPGVTAAEAIRRLVAANAPADPAAGWPDPTPRQP